MTAISAYLDAHSARRESIHSVLETPRRTLLLTLGLDSVAILIATIVGFNVTPLAGADSTVNAPWWIGPAIGVAWLLALQRVGAYSTRHMRAGDTEFRRVTLATMMIAAIVGIGSYLLAYTLSRTFFMALFATGLVGLLTARLIRREALKRLHAQGRLLTPVMVAGGLSHVDSVASVLRREKWLGYNVLGALTVHPDDQTPGGLDVLGTLADIPDVLARFGVRIVIFAEGSFDSPADFRRMAWDLERHDVQMIVVPTLADVSSQRMDIRPVAGLPLLDVERPQAIASTRALKRISDAAGALILLLLAAPIMAIVALFIRAEDRGPVLFRQTRVGLNGEEFQCLKFRSMRVDAEAMLAELQARNEGAGVLFKMANDPRVTRVGKLIRRFSVDELPQLWNVVRGDMSLVGPRPALPREVADYEPDTRRRLDVRPGLTGLWQVSGRSNLSWDDTIRLDLYYVDNWCFAQDLMILAKTAKAVVGSDGAY